MQTVGLVLLGAFDYMNTSNIDGLEKREQNNTVTEMQHVLYFGSQFGLHVATHMRNNVTELVNSIIGVETPGSLPDTLSGAHSLQRRISYFDVNWISWNWDNVNVDLTKKAETSAPRRSLLQSGGRRNESHKYHLRGLHIIYTYGVAQQQLIKLCD
ncbi:AVN_HP_G0032230.mRNA.1.CDS.1 [Saccharomyces cerevisiae]|nr:AVN_HP_G0032230.mRNA.1.CDS.1 [Saccharomyces cerevisiae]CAI6844089.1 AVN_HP_G0032230.mRNA.1.CDS.1 [Saccharomyces cerevisiae]